MANGFGISTYLDLVLRDTRQLAALATWSTGQLARFRGCRSPEVDRPDGIHFSAATGKNSPRALFHRLGADIGLDGSFVGQTLSSVLALPGDHYIKIMKTGYKPWEPTIRTSGGEVTVFAELDPRQ
jgi:PEGA domain